MFFLIYLTSNVDGRVRKTKTQAHDENCPDTAKENFDINRYHGVWYEVLAFPYLPTSSGKCMMSSYALNEDKITIFSRFIDSNRMQSRTMGFAKQKSPGILSVTFSSARKFLR